MSPPGPDEADEATDAAWERLALLVQAFVASEHQPATTSAGRPLQGQAAVADLEKVQASALHLHLLVELASDQLQEALRTRIVPGFWVAVASPEGGEPGDEASPRWGFLLAAASAALRRAHEAHRALLRELAGDHLQCANAADEAYCAGFRVLLVDNWPASLAKQLLRYFRHTWRSLSACTYRGCHVGRDAEEWWWAPPHRSAAAPRSPGARVRTLLTAGAQRPAAWPRGGDATPGAGGEAKGHSAPPPPWPPAEHLGGEGEGLEEEEEEVPMQTEEDGKEEDELLARILAGDEGPLSGLRGVAVDFQRIGLGEAWRDLVMRFVIEELSETVKEKCGHAYEAKGLLDQLTTWLYAPLLRWLRAAHGVPCVAGAQLPHPVDEDSKAAFEAEDAWWVAARSVVLQFFDTFVEVRIREAFEMIKDFPDSAPALLDLRRCLARTGRAAPLVRALRQQLGRRLLIAGAHTRDVIKVYIKTIKAMRLVDPRGLLLEAVSAPIRAYLKRRKDTVRCIITALTEDTDMQQELQFSAEASQTASQRRGAAGGAAATGPPVAGPLLELPELSFGAADMEASDDEEDPDAWMPDPIDADPQLAPRQRRMQDVISLLVGIYGSREMFIKEYKDMLADRLLGNPSYSTEREMQHLELLKARFGEAAMVHCEVMLQDIKDSRRINANIQQHVKSRAARKAAPTPVRGPGEAPGAPGSGRGFSAPFGLSSMFGLRTIPQAATAIAKPLWSPAPATPVVRGTTAGGQPPLQQTAAASTPAAGATRDEQPKLALDQMHALVLSQHYWPAALSKADHPHFKLPPPLEQCLEEYAAAYAQTRAKRAVHWKRAHGLVEITVQLKDRSVPVMVTPVHFAVLACFAEGSSTGSGSTAAPPRASLSLQEVAQKLELPEAVVRKRIGFWVAKGVLREVSAGVFDVQESLSTMESAGGNHLDEDVEHSPGQAVARPSGLGGREGACAAELEACESFIQGMLNNYGSLPLGRLHQLLQMLMMDPLYTQTEMQLRGFLHQLCNEGKLEFNGSHYALAKKA